MNDVLTPIVGAYYRTRNGTLVQVTGYRDDATKLNYKGYEYVWLGKFLPERGIGGGLCAWNRNGTYRASSGQVPHALDITAVVK